jgi:hypothetical protein
MLHPLSTPEKNKEKITKGNRNKCINQPDFTLFTLA